MSGRTGKPILTHPHVNWKTGFFFDLFHKESRAVVVIVTKQACSKRNGVRICGANYKKAPTALRISQIISERSYRTSGPVGLTILTLPLTSPCCRVSLC